MSSRDGYAPVYPQLGGFPSFPRPPPYNPESLPAPSAPDFSALRSASWLSWLSRPAVYLPLLKVSVGVGVTCCCLWYAYRAGQRSQRQRQPYPHQQQQRRAAREDEERKESEERPRAFAAVPPLSITWWDVLPGASPSTDAISPGARRSLRRTCMYILSGLSITGGTVAYLALLAPRSSSVAAVFSSLSSHQTRLIAFLTTALSALAVQLLSKRHVRAKHLAFLLFHVGSGFALAPLFFLPNPLVLRAALATSAILASAVALTLSARTRSSVWLYSPVVVGSSLLVATGLYDLIALIARRGAAVESERSSLTARPQRTRHSGRRAAAVRGLRRARPAEAHRSVGAHGARTTQAGFGRRRPGRTCRPAA